MKNPTFRKTICKSKIWNDWIKHQEKKMEWDVHESTECGWLSEEHWDSFLSWYLKINHKQMFLLDRFLEAMPDYMKRHWGVKEEKILKDFIQSQLNKRDKEIIERIEQLKWEGRLTGLQILDRLIEDIKNNL